MERAAPFRGVGLDLGASLFDELGDEPLELRAELSECLLLLLARSCEPLGVGPQARVVVVQGLLLALAEPRELPLELLLAAVEVGGPGHQAGLEPSLGVGNRAGQLRAGVLGLARDRVAPLLGELTLLLAQRVAGLRALPGEHALDLGTSLLGVLVEEGVEPGPRLVADPLHVADATQAAREQEEPRLAKRRHEEPADRDQQERGVVRSFGDLEAGDDGACECEGSQGDCRPQQQALGHACERDRDERHGDDGQCGRKGNLERQSHP